MAIAKWSWTHSNGTATDAETVSSYNALTIYVEERDWYGSTGNFYSTVWNDLVNKVKEVVDAAPIAWNDSHRSYANTLMTTDKDLYADSFNALVENSGYREYYWAKDSSLRGYTGTLYFNPGNVVYAKYFITLTDILNAIIETINNRSFFNAELLLLTSIITTMTTLECRCLQSPVNIAVNIEAKQKADYEAELMASLLALFMIDANLITIDVKDLGIFLIADIMFNTAMRAVLLEQLILPLDILSLFTAEAELTSAANLTASVAYITTIDADEFINATAIDTFISSLSSSTSISATETNANANESFSSSFSAITSFIATITEGMQRLGIECDFDFTLTLLGNLDKLNLSGPFLLMGLSSSASATGKAYLPDASTWEYPVPQYPIVPARLPDAYQEVEYIQSSSRASQYIDTGVSAGNDVEISGQFVYLSGDNGRGLFGVDTQGDVAGEFSLLQDNNQLYLRCHWYNYVADTTANLQNVTTSFVLQGPDAGGSIQMNLLTNTARAINTSKTIYIGKINSNNSATAMGTNSRFLTFVIKVAGVKVREFIPCYRKQGHYVGYYDLVNSQFYPSQGGQDFVAGPDVPSVYSYKITYIPQSFNYSITEGVLTID